MSIDRLARPEIMELSPFGGVLPLGTAEQARLNANENPYRDPADQALGQEINRYPESQPSALRRRLGERYGTPPENILITRGSDEGIDLLVRAFCRPGKDSIIQMPPTFEVYELAARIQGAGILDVPLMAGDFSVDVAGVLDAAKSAQAKGPAPKLLFLCSPVNPAGNLIERSVILALLEQLPDTLVVVDEAYIEFTEAHSMIADIDSHENLVVLRTLSKAYGLAGARCGSVIGSPEIISLVARVIAPYPVPEPVASAALSALSPAGLARTEEIICNIRRDREALATALAGLDSVTRVFPSVTNFLLVQFIDAAKAVAACTNAGVLVRDRSHLVAGAVRISIGTPDENARLLAALVANVDSQVGDVSVPATI